MFDMVGYNYPTTRTLTLGTITLKNIQSRVDLQWFIVHGVHAWYKRVKEIRWSSLTYEFTGVTILNVRNVVYPILGSAQLVKNRPICRHSVDFNVWSSRRKSDRSPANRSFCYQLRRPYLYNIVDPIKFWFWNYIGFRFRWSDSLIYKITTFS